MPAHGWSGPWKLWKLRGMLDISRRHRMALAGYGVAVAGAICGSVWLTGAQQRPPALQTPRLYVFDLGKLTIADPKSFNLTREEVATTDLVVAGYLVAHPKGTLIWDTGVVPDNEVGTTARGAERAEGRRLTDQLAEIGYRPADIMYLGLSHYHSDHTANANAFQGATWLVPSSERGPMFAAKPPAIVNPSHFSALKNSKTILIDRDEYDVFGDGTAMIVATPGHTPGHQVLIVKLAKMPPIVLAGDLYHYPEERRLGRFPIFEFNVEQSRASRARVEDYLVKNKALLWIEHDAANHRTLKKSPAYYE
jgi:glyoxylase-like metal-dependent hydrolase (beta-lactamase superfamily II)